MKVDMSSDGDLIALDIFMILFPKCNNGTTSSTYREKGHIIHIQKMKIIWSM